MGYTIGLDIGTGSVGWCVINNQNEILKFNDKPMWGVRLFQTAETAETRRKFRTSRRNIRRRKKRLELLQFLFQDQIYNIDNNFFRFLVESDKWLENNQNRFSNSTLSEILIKLNVDLKSFPTIYHLQQHILNTKEKIDLRLLFLAIHTNVKNRGHFLIEQDYKKFKNEKPSLEKLQEVFDFANIDLSKEQIENAIEILANNKLKKRDKDKELKNISKESKFLDICKLLYGSEVEFKNENSSLFNIDKKISLDVADDSRDYLNDLTDSELELLELLDAFRLSLILNDLISGYEYVSEVFVSRYEEYKKQLKDLKQIVKRIDKKTYTELFVSKNNKCLLDQYNFGVTKEGVSKKLNLDDFSKELGKTLTSLLSKAQGGDIKLLEDIINQVNERKYLVKIRTSENRALPHQLKSKEVEKMLNMQKEYYDFIDDQFIEKVISLIEFRIPYYIGPLSQREEHFAWISRNNNDKITPWNFKDVINESESAEKFITRMTNKCQYFYLDDYVFDNSVLPKTSLLYQEFEVYNELNNISYSINGKRMFFDNELRIKIINELFKKYDKVSLKRLEDFLTKNVGDHIFNREVLDTLSGFQSENGFATSLSTYNKFHKLGFDMENPDVKKDVEDIIKILTIYNEGSIIKKELNKINSIVNEDNINKIVSIKVSGWGRLCRHLLENVFVDNQNIIDAMKNGIGANQFPNFSKLVNDKKCGFEKKINEINNISDESFTVTYDDIASLACSPALKRGINQSIKIVQEIEKLMNEAPENIILEVAKEDAEKNRTTSRKDLYKKIKSTLSIPKLTSEQDDDNWFRNQRNWLYVLQDGKCLYTGETLDINNLSNYDIDHIIPRSITKDNSFENLALVDKQFNAKKGDKGTAFSVATSNAKAHWIYLLNNKMLTQLKFQRLMKEEVSEYDIARFQQRSLVETRQIIKHVKNLLNEQYTKSNVIAVKAGVLHNIKSELEITKDRDINNKHHAIDAYFAASIGNTINKSDMSNFLDPSLDIKEFIRVNKSNNKLDATKLERLIQNIYFKYCNNTTRSETAEFIKNQLKSEYVVSYKTRKPKSDLWNQTNYAFKDSKRTQKNIPIAEQKKFKSQTVFSKDSLIHTGVNIQSILIVEYDKITMTKNTKKVSKVREFTVLESYAKNYNKLEYIMNKLETEKIRVSNLSIIREIPVGQLVELDGRRFKLISTSEIATAFEITETIEYEELCNKFNALEKIINRYLYITFEVYLQILSRNSKIVTSSDMYKQLKEEFKKYLFFPNTCVYLIQLSEILFDNYEQINNVEHLNEILSTQLNKLLVQKNNELAEVIIRGRGDIFTTEERVEKLYNLKNELSGIDFEKEIRKLFTSSRTDKLSFSRLSGIGWSKLKHAKIVNQSVTGLEEVYTNELALLKRKK